MTRPQASTVGRLVTREVRWFQPGEVPADIVDWFTASGSLGVRSQRVDLYSTASAAEGVGLKLRGGSAFEVKFLSSPRGKIALAPQVHGRVEDWVKIPNPLRAPPSIDRKHWVNVEKQLIKRYYIVRTATGQPQAVGGAGCGVELANIRTGGVRAWSLCLETFGPFELLDQLLRAGVDGLMKETPIPDGLQLTAADSYGYPTWISMTQGFTAGTD